MLIRLTDLKETYGVNPKTVLHIGASHGEERDSYRDNGVEEVTWIEALPDVFEKLCENIKDYHGHTAINACIHETADLVLDFNVSSNDGQSSSIYQFGTHADVHPDVKFVNKIQVITSRADHWIEKAPDMINLDIQGAELLALKSMSWLKQVHWIYCEVNKKELYQGCALIEDIDAYLATFGFERKATVWAGDTGWGDALYINNL